VHAPFPRRLPGRFGPSPRRPRRGAFQRARPPRSPTDRVRSWRPVDGRRQQILSSFYVTLPSFQTPALERGNYRGPGPGHGGEVMAISNSAAQNAVPIGRLQLRLAPGPGDPGLTLGPLRRSLPRFQRSFSRALVFTIKSPILRPETPHRVSLKGTGRSNPACRLCCSCVYLLSPRARELSLTRKCLSRSLPRRSATNTPTPVPFRPGHHHLFIPDPTRALAGPAACVPGESGLARSKSELCQRNRR